ncbi:MAG: hypothetical protein EPN45_04475 [Rhizobiaceae bacterium]|nr:MAG: hypothetical protein EPN45_04475 [Rhizobiaceae bacterium]
MDQDGLAEIFTDQAEWRRQKAKEHPEDARNLEAARHLDMLAQSAKGVDQSLITAAEELYEDIPDIEIWNEMLRQVGVWTFPSSAEDFLREFISKRSSGR